MTFKSPRVYSGSNNKKPKRWSAAALSGAVSTILMIAATRAKFQFIPTMWNNTSHLTRRLIFHFIILALTAGLTFYIAIFNHSTSQLLLILGVVQFFIACVATLLFD